MSISLEIFHALGRLGSFAPSPCGSFAIAAVAKLSEDGSKRQTEFWRVTDTPDLGATLWREREEGLSAPRFDDQGHLYFLSKAKTKNDEAQEVHQVWRQIGSEPAVALTDEPLGVIDFRVAAQSLVVLCPLMLDTPLAEMRARAREQAKGGPSAHFYKTMPLRAWDRWAGGNALHLVHYDLNGSNRRDLTPSFEQELANDHGLAWDLSGDGNALATVFERPGPDRLPDSGLLLVHLASGAHRHLGCQDRVTHQGLRFSPDGARIAATRHLRKSGTQGAVQLALYECRSEESRLLVTDWQAVPTIEAWQDDETLLVCSPNKGDVAVYRIHLATESVEALASGASYAAIQVANGHAWGQVSSFAKPPELFRMNLEGTAQPEIVSALYNMPESDIEVQRKTCLGDGDTPVDYFLLRKRAWQSDAKPTLLWIHGGPVSSWTDGWHWRWNPLPFLAAGYQVALPNPRGSTGYGQRFIEEVCNNQWGGACFADLMAVTDDLCANLLVDNQKLVAMGGSFGGYMSNWIGTQTDRFAAIITHASVYRFGSFHGTTDYPAYWALHMGLYPSDNEEEYNRFSPHRHIDAWKTPVLITHGEKDYRVPISESLMLFEDLHRRAVPVKLLVFPDENHWILKPRNSERWYSACLEFIDHELGR